MTRISRKLLICNDKRLELPSPLPISYITARDVVGRNFGVLDMNIVTIGKLNESVEIDFGALPEVSQAFIIQYGLKQLLNDALVSGETDDERRGLVHKKLDGLKSGMLRSASTRTSDPVAREVKRLATINADKWARGQTGKLTDVRKSAAYADVMRQLSGNAKIIARAKELAEENDLEIEL